MPSMSTILGAVGLLSVVSAQQFADPIVNYPKSSSCVQSTGPAPPLPADLVGLSKGPKYGTLVIAGGSLPQNSTVFQEMLMLAGGQENAKAIYFPTNGGGNYDGIAGERALESFEELTGWKDVTLMHTYDPLVADTEEFWAPLEEANLVYFAGGLPYRSYDSYFGTGTQAAIDRLLQRGGVFGGSSAGALMQPNVMLRGDSSNNNAIMLGDHVEGFALGEMENVVVDVHYLERNRGYDMIDAIDVYPDHVGFSIDEGTALVMEPGNDEAYVIGTGWVAVYDPTLWQETKFCADFRRMNGNARPLLANNGRYFFLRQRSNGRPDRYNIATREVVQSSDFMDSSMDDYSIEE